MPKRTLNEDRKNSELSLKEVDNKLISKILDKNYIFEGEVNFLARVDDFHGEENTLTYVNNTEYLSKAIELGYKYILTDQKDIDDDNAIFLLSNNPREDFLKIVHFLNKNKKFKDLKN